MTPEEQFPETVVQRPPEGWMLGEVTLHIERPEEKKLTVEAWRRGVFAVHQRIFADGEAEEAVITHAPTGYRICALDTMDDAAGCAELLESLTDWSAISKKFPPGSKLYPKVKKTVDRFQSRGVVGSPKHE
jgi:hypothetical protein